MKRKLLFFSLFFTRAIFSTEKNLLSFEKEAAYVKKAFEVVGKKADTKKLLLFYSKLRPQELKKSCEMNDNNDVYFDNDDEYFDAVANHVSENLKKFGLAEKTSILSEKNMKKIAWKEQLIDQENYLYYFVFGTHRLRVTPWNATQALAFLRTEKIMALQAQMKVLACPVPKGSERKDMLPQYIKNYIASYLIDDIIVFCSYKKFADYFLDRKIIHVGGVERFHLVQSNKKEYCCTIF